MIFDANSRMVNFRSEHALFPAAAEFLARDNLLDLPDGRHDIQGDDLFAIIARADGKDAGDAPLEVHKAYVDIQMVLEGIELMGWKPLSNCVDPSSDYDSEKDIQFFADRPDTWLKVNPFQLVVFFPEDAHAPLVSDGPVHKVVVKVVCQ